MKGIIEYLLRLKDCRFKEGGGIKIFPKLTENEFNRIYRNNCASNDQIKQIWQLYLNIKTALEEYFSAKNIEFILKPFGSVANGFMLNTAFDLDLTLIIDDEKYTYEPKSKIYFGLDKVWKKLSPHPV